MAKFYNKRDSIQPAQDSVETNIQTSNSYIGKSLKLKGNVNSKEPITIDGEIKGNIKSSEKITIGRSGHFNGEIKAKTVKVLGKAKGEISASDKLEICSQGDFEGNLKTNKLVIEEGAIFNGTSTMEDTSGSFPSKLEATSIQKHDSKGTERGKDNFNKNKN